MENRFLFPAQSLVIFSWRGDEGSRTLIVRFTRPTLCYPLELHRHLKLVDWEGVKLSQEVCRTSMLSVTPARNIHHLTLDIIGHNSFVIVRTCISKMITCPRVPNQ